uniref:Uncharacterized protein n=1 Tax=Sarcoptes scabiei TaxID=52283 RepID=A0A834RB56_SARSC
MRTTYEIDCLKFSKLSISSPPNSRKDFRSTNSNNSATNNSCSLASGIDYRSSNLNGFKPLLPRIEFPTNQFDRLLHMDHKEFKNNWRSNSFEIEKKKK